MAAQVTAEYIEVPAAEPMPEEFEERRIRRSVLILAAVLVAVVVLVALLPGLGSVREAFSGARPGWLVAAVLLEALSCLSYVLVFRGVFCQRMRWVTSYEIGTAELGANSLLSVGGVGGLALGAWILRRGGMRGAAISRRTVAFFLLTSFANVVALILAGLALWVGVLEGSSSDALDIVPAVAGGSAIVLAITGRRVAAAVAGRSSRDRVARTLRALADGVDEAVSLLRAGRWSVLVGSTGYLLFDVAVLGACFAAFGHDVPSGGVLLVAYLVGQLGGLIPIPGGIGGVDGGLIGALVIYGVDATHAAVAVLAYRAIVLWLPVFLGLPALASLRRRLRTEAHDIAACAPDDEVEILGRGPVPATELGRS